MLKSKFAEFSATVVIEKELNSIIGGVKGWENGVCNKDGSITLYGPNGSSFTYWPK